MNYNVTYSFFKLIVIFIEITNEKFLLECDFYHRRWACLDEYFL